MALPSLVSPSSWWASPAHLPLQLQPVPNAGGVPTAAPTYVSPLAEPVLVIQPAMVVEPSPTTTATPTAPPSPSAPAATPTEPTTTEPTPQPTVTVTETAAPVESGTQEVALDPAQFTAFILALALMVTLAGIRTLVGFRR